MPMASLREELDSQEDKIDSPFARMKILPGDYSGEQQNILQRTPLENLNVELKNTIGHATFSCFS